MQDRLAQEGIHVSVTSLSYWQHGRSQPERPASLRAEAVEVHAVRDCAVGRVLRDTSAAVLVAEQAPQRRRRHG